MAWLWAVPLNGALGLAAWLVARHAFHQPRGFPRALAAVVFAWAWATLGMEILGPLGLFAVVPLMGWSLLGVLVGLVCRGLDRWPEPPPPKAEGDAAWEWEPVAAVALVLWAALLLGARSLLLPVKVVSDGPIYHLYFAARWWKAERLFLVAAPFGENAAPYFPAVGDLWFAWLMVSWGGDRLAKVGQAPFLLVAALASYAMARRLGANRAPAIIATTCFVSSAPLLLFSFEPNVDTLFVAGYLLAAYFFVRDALGDDRGPSLALGALAAGGALGTKATGIVFIPPLLGLVLVVKLLRSGPLGRKLGAVATVAVLPMVTAGYWFARNAWLTGNPLYPLHVEAFGRVWLAGWYGADVMRLSPYYLPMRDLRSLSDIILAVLDPRLVPLWALALAGAWSVVRLDRPRRLAVGALALLAVVNVALYWVAMPYRTQQRFMLHALGLAVVPFALTLQTGRWLRSAAVLLLAVHLLTPQDWPLGAPGRPAPWDLSPVIPSAVPPLIPLLRAGEGPRPSASVPVPRKPQVATIVLGLAALAMAWSWSRAVARPTRGRWAGAILTLALASGIAALAVWPGFADPRRLFYPPFPDYYAGWLELDQRSGRQGVRVAYAGTNIPYYLLGAGLRNEVRYINIDGHRDWLLHDYHRDARTRGEASSWPHPRPGWDRIHPDYNAWLANLRAERIQLLVVARANPAEGPHNVADREGFPIERVWADEHPETFEPLYGVAPPDPRMKIYRVRALD